MSLCLKWEEAEGSRRGKVWGKEFMLRDATPSFALLGWEKQWRGISRERGGGGGGRWRETERADGIRHTGWLIQNLSACCLRGNTWEERKLCKDRREEKEEETKRSQLWKKRNCEACEEAKKNRSKSAWESLQVWWILIGQCLPRHANEKVNVLWVNGKSMWRGGTPTLEDD